MALQNEVTTSAFFVEWLVNQQVCLAFSTYQTGKLFMVGLQDDHALSIVDRSFERPMGLCIHNNSLYMSSLYQLWRFENMLEAGQIHHGYDRLYVPQVAYTTGEVDIHDIGIDANDKVVFVNTLFSCLATVSETHSFVPLWSPPFISELVPEDQCHLNGMALDPETGQPKYVTVVNQSDIPMGWWGYRKTGGSVIDINSNKTIITGLSMPHSPRLHNDKLWLLDSGAGRFGYVNIDDGCFEEVAFCPGFARGLSLLENYAVVAISLPRSDDTYAGLDLDEKIRAHKGEPFCGILIIDLNKGDVIHWLRIEGAVSELYDVVVMPDTIRPAVLGVETDEIQHTIRIG